MGRYAVYLTQHCLQEPQNILTTYKKVHLDRIVQNSGNKTNLFSLKVHIVTDLNYTGYQDCNCRINDYKKGTNDKHKNFIMIRKMQ